MIIAVDFDGTIVKHRYPNIGAPIPYAIETLKKLQDECHTLILWSVREGDKLQEAVDYCRANGVEFYAVNCNHPDERVNESPNYSRKLQADLFIDDRNLGGLPDWNDIYYMIHFRQSFKDVLTSNINECHKVDKKSFWSKLFGY